MSDTPGMYTSPNAGTPQGSQYDQTSSMMASMGNGQPMPQQQLQQATQATSQATSQLGQMQTPQARGQFVNNGDLPAIQSNYDQLARQLFDTDRAIAASGQYNQNPAPDATSFGSVGPSPLELTNSVLGSNSFNPVNPGIGMQTQIAQQGSIIDLLNTLNQSSAREFGSRKNAYASSVKGQQAIVDTLMNLLGKNADLGMNKYNQEQENYRAGLSAGGSSGNKLLDEADKLRADLSTGQLEWGDAWSQLRNRFPDASSDEIDHALGGRYDASDPDGSKGLTHGWAVPGAAQEYASSGGTRFKPKDVSTQNNMNNIIPALTNLEKTYNKLSTINKFNPGSNSEYETERNLIADMLAKQLGVNRNGTQIQRLLDQLPTAWDALSKNRSAGKFLAFHKELGYQTGQLYVKENATGNEGYIPREEFDPSKYTEL